MSEEEKVQEETAQVESVQDEVKEEPVQEEAVQEEAAAEEAATEETVTEEPAAEEAATEKAATEAPAEEKKEKKAKLEVSAEALKKSIAAYDRASVKKQVEGGALAEVDPEELPEVMKSLVLLLDESIVDAMAKKVDKFSADMLDMDYSNYNKRNFAAALLKKHIKKFDLTDAEAAAKVFDVAIACDSKDAVEYMIKNKLCADQYPQIMTCSEDVYTLALRLKKKDLDPDTVVAFYVTAAFDDDADEKLRFLKDNKFDVNAKNSKGQTISEAAAELLQGKKYAANKNGNLQKLADEQALKSLKRILSGEEEKKPLISKNALIIAVPIVVAAVVFAYVCVEYYGKSNGVLGESTEVAEEETTDETTDTTTEDVTTDEITTDDTTTTYSTDTTHQVVEGDTVNIDYVGVIDGVQFDGGTGNYDLTIGSGQFIDGFEDQLVGAYVGDQVLVDVTFPEDYASEEVAGKDAEFTVTINGVY